MPKRGSYLRQLLQNEQVLQNIMLLNFLQFTDSIKYLLFLMFAVVEYEI